MKHLYYRFKALSWIAAPLLVELQSKITIFFRAMVPTTGIKISNRDFPSGPVVKTLCSPWRLNNKLLNNQEITEGIKQEIKKYVEGLPWWRSG